MTCHDLVSLIHRGSKNNICKKQMHFSMWPNNPSNTLENRTLDHSSISTAARYMYTFQYFDLCSSKQLVIIQIKLYGPTHQQKEPVSSFTLGHHGKMSYFLQHTSCTYLFLFPYRILLWQWKFKDLFLESSITIRFSFKWHNVSSSCNMSESGRRLGHDGNPRNTWLCCKHIWVSSFPFIIRHREFQARINLHDLLCFKGYLLVYR